MQRYSLKLENRIEQLIYLTNGLEAELTVYDIPVNEIFTIILVMEELFVNQVSYGYHDQLIHTIDIDIQWDEKEKEITIWFKDDGDEFNILKKPDPNINLSVEERPIGGLGIFFVKQKMDYVSYDRCNNLNIITLKKKIQFNS